MAFNDKNKPQQKSNKEAYPKLGQILRSKDGGLYIQLNDRVTVTVNGVDVTGRTASLEKPSAKFERMLASGVMSEEEAQEKIDDYEDGGRLDFVRQEITIKLV
jgi:flagellar basal body rod protein FlgF